MEQLTEYLRKSNNSQVHTKSDNVFSLKSPNAVLSNTNAFGSNGRNHDVSLDDYDPLVWLSSFTINPFRLKFE